MTTPATSDMSPTGRQRLVEATTIPVQLDVDDVARISRRTPKAIRQLWHRRLHGDPVGPRFRKIDGRLLTTEDEVARWLAGESSTTADAKPADRQ
jgi:hypothetical protein